jgi:hypothetical protein
MSFTETVDDARKILREQGRISLAALGLRCGLDASALEVLVEQLTKVQQVAVREGQSLRWIGPGSEADRVD